MSVSQGIPPVLFRVLTEIHKQNSMIFPCMKLFFVIFMIFQVFHCFQRLVGTLVIAYLIYSVTIPGVYQISVYMKLCVLVILQGPSPVL